MDTDIALLARLWRAWHVHGGALSTVDWRRPTRCGDWTVAALYAHVSQGVAGLDALLDRPAPEDAAAADAAPDVPSTAEFVGLPASRSRPAGPTVSAASTTESLGVGPPVVDAAALLRRFHRDASAPAGPDNGLAAELAGRNSRRAVVDAGRSDPRELVARFGDPAADVLSRAEPCLDVVVDYFGHGRVRIADAVLIRIMEATVHLLDLDHALGRAPSPTPDAVARSLGLLMAVPDQVHLLEAATGRHSDPVFPLLA